MNKILLVLLCVCSAAFAAPKDNLVIDGSPIAAACVAALNDSMVNVPYISSINLTECQKQHANDIKVKEQGLPGYHRCYHDNNSSRGSYGYRVLGETSQGVFVLSTYSSGGGSGTFTNIALVKLDQSSMFSSTKDEEIPSRQSFMRLTLLGNIRGGDRCYDGLTDEKLVGDQLTFKKYQNGKTAVDCVNPKSYSIDLSQL